MGTVKGPTAKAGSYYTNFFSSHLSLPAESVGSLSICVKIRLRDILEKMMKKIQNFILLPISIISIISIWFFPSSSVIWTNISKTIPLIFSILVIAYNNIAMFYKLIRRAIIWWSGDTVSWESTFKCFVFSELGEVNRKIDTFIGEQKLIVINRTSTKYDLKFKEEGHTKNIEIFLTQKPDKVQIRFVYCSSVAYKDSKNEFNFFDKKLLEFLSKFEHSNGRYSLKIILKKYNPFYILSVQHINKPKKIDFRLEFEDDGVNLKLYPYSLEATSEDKGKIQRVFKDYITVSSIGERVSTM